MSTTPTSTLRFCLRQWSAWAPGLETREAWSGWDGTLPHGDASPKVDAMPAMLRRRADRLGKMTLETLYAPDIAYHGQPLIHASRHGEATRTVPLLQALARDGAVSPQAFSMAVHNATAGLFTIATRTHAPVTAIAAGPETALAGLLEACSQLADGAASVLLCFSDEPLPALYQPYADTAEAPFALTLDLVAGDDFTLGTGAACTEDATPLSLLHFLLGGETALPLSIRGGWQIVRSAM
ncbi:beta-ketoacyl synthase chain length factor [Jeongeupia naejangsanensis]|uniref:Beta-ketoacyl synthase chain length factor n=1 Tax=Jeongeupia naejangsanensis TaxID=613195 RepID=A0ABS2BQS9_9NEIS|nr:beta-ketoacyl synthase chain length factor [Jeongeupia naejangsanensis]MBM3117139.1 beta-ketoacyl synthase chain length factor [Jeongeupia naejangsanensis]